MRHPLYASLLLLAWGAFLKNPASPLAALLIATARAEEVASLGKFGEEYLAYMRQTKMFIPFVF